MKEDIADSWIIWVTGSHDYFSQVLHAPEVLPMVNLLNFSNILTFLYYHQTSVSLDVGIAFLIVNIIILRIFKFSCFLFPWLVCKVQKLLWLWYFTCQELWDQINSSLWSFCWDCTRSWGICLIPSCWKFYLCYYFTI